MRCLQHERHLILTLGPFGQNCGKQASGQDTSRNRYRQEQGFCLVFLVPSDIFVEVINPNARIRVYYLE